MKQLKKPLSLLLALLMTVLPLGACSPQNTADPGSPSNATVATPQDAGQSADTQTPALGPAVTAIQTLALGDTPLDEEGWYTGKEEVALYLMQYGSLPGNYMTKSDAQALGWEGGSLETFAPGKAIGGDRFGNYEGSLPEEDGRTYTECDIDTQGTEDRGAKRIVFSNDGLIFYTDDHYETFTLIQGEE